MSQSQLATMAGVSRATVSRALADHPAISSEISERIQALARQMNYRPNAAARSFAMRRHNMIAVVLCDRSPVLPVYAMLLEGVEKAAQDGQLKLQLAMCASAQLRQDHLPPTFQDDGVDGVVLTGAVPDHLLERIASWSMPCVMIGSQQGIAGINHVAGDPRMGGRLMAKHLLELGHRRIGLLIGPRSRSIHAEYWHGFRDACVEAGIDEKQVERRTEPCESNDVVPPMRRLMERMPDLTALFADTDAIAWQAMQYLRAIGKRVPQDISVGGAGNTVGTMDGAIQMTTIDTRLHEMSRVAVERLREIIGQSEFTSHRIIVDPVLVPGSTTGRYRQK